MANNRVFVPGFNSILEVDLATGDRVELSGPGAGSGPQLQFVNSPVLDLANSRILVQAGFPDKTIIAIDLGSGIRTVFSGAGTGTGEALDSPLDMVLDESGNRLLVTQNSGPVLAIDLDTGDRSIFSDGGVGGGEALTTTLGIALDATNNWAFVSSGGRVYSIDLTTRDRNPASWFSDRSGIVVQMDRLALDAGRNLIYSPEPSLGAIVAMDLASSDVVIVSK
jgi:hypothetical protein